MESLLQNFPGRRVCLGQQLAGQELFIFFTTIMLHFNVKVPEGITVDLEAIQEGPLKLKTLSSDIWTKTMRYITTLSLCWCIHLAFSLVQSKANVSNTSEGCLSTFLWLLFSGVSSLDIYCVYWCFFVTFAWDLCCWWSLNYFSKLHSQPRSLSNVFSYRFRADHRSTS